jgi:class 3 adenylate cyclase
MFTDMVGSTELSARLGDADADKLFRVHFRLLRDAIATNGGREVKSLGDGLMAVFPSATEAVSCAVAMQQGAHHHSQRMADQTARLRVGLNAGDVIETDGDYFGAAVTAAKRLCDRADGGQIFAGGTVRALMGCGGGVSYLPIGGLSLKGLPEPVETLRGPVGARRSRQLATSTRSCRGRRRDLHRTDDRVGRPADRVRKGTSRGMPGRARRR